MAGKIGDLLAADSLLLTILAVMYGVWYAEIVAALDLRPNALPAMDKDNHEVVSRVFKTRAAPLALGCVIVAATFLPDAFNLARPVFEGIVHGDFPARYNAVSTSLFVVTLGATALALHLVDRAWAVFKHRADLDPKRPPPMGAPASA